MVEAAREAVLTGGCQCGAVRYALHAAPEGAHLCHCRMCQKAVGGPFAALAMVREGDLSWTRGGPATFRSSSLAERGFCAACGTPLTFRYPGQGWIDVTLGSLDRPAEVPPARQCGIESRLAWLGGLDALPAEESGADDPSTDLAAITRYQHPDHDTPPDWRPPPPGPGG